MKQQSIFTKLIRSLKAAGVAAAASLLIFTPAAHAATAPPLGAADTFSVLGGSTVTNVGPTIISGDLGVSPGTSITGFPPGVVTGTIYSGAGSLAGTAQTATVNAYNILAAEATTTNLTGQDLGGLTLTPGVYTFNSSAQLTGNLILNPLGNPNATFVFQTGTTITTATGATVTILGGVSDPNVFWQIGSSATLGTGTAFEGNILALQSITLDPSATISTGRALAINGAVTFAGGTNFISRFGSPTPPTPPVGTGFFWNGKNGSLWSGSNWSPDATGGVITTLAPSGSGANVFFSVTGITPRNQGTTSLDLPENIASLTVSPSRESRE